MVCWSLLSWFNSLRAIWEIYPTPKTQEKTSGWWFILGSMRSIDIYIYMPPGWECHKTHDEVSGLMRKSKSSNRLQSHKETTHGPVSHKNENSKVANKKTNPHLKLWCLRDPPWQLSWHISYFPRTLSYLRALSKSDASDADPSWGAPTDDPSRSSIHFKPQRSSYLVVHPT